MIPEETVERVREAADIVQIVGEHVKLRRSGRNYRGPCPLHGGKNPNFSVSPDKGVYHCFTCQESGNVFTFLERMLGVDYPTAIRMVADRVGIEIVETHRRAEQRDDREPLWELNATAAHFFQRSLWEGDAGGAARAYLDSRGITRAVADRFGLGYAPGGNAVRAYFAELGFGDERLLEVGLLTRRDDDATSEPYSRFRDRLMIPIHDTAGHPVGFGGRLLVDREGAAKYLNSPESRTFQKRRLLYNLHQAKHAIRRAERALLVEGYFDVVRLAAAGIEEVVAPLGTALTEEQATLLSRYTKNVFLLYDSDEAGQKATFRSGLALLALGVAVRVVSLPDGEDPDSFVRKFGRDKLEAQIEDAIDVFELQIRILEQKGWFADLHRRRRAVDRLLPTIRATADRLTRDIYVARLSEAAGVTRELLLAEVAAGEARASGPAGRGHREPGGPASPLPPADAGGPPPESFDHASDRGGPTGRRTGDRRRFSGRRDGDEWRSNRAPLRPSATAGPERELLRVLLHEPARAPAAAERLDATLLADPLYQELFVALTRNDTEAPVTEILANVSERAARVADALLGDPPPGDVSHLFESSVNLIKVREIDAEINRLEALQATVDPEEWRRLVERIGLLSKQKRDLGGRRFKVGRPPSSPSRVRGDRER
ncbi:MAG: DNA primase [Gemmatimonadaceae bacterium]